MTKLADELEALAKDAAPPPPEIHSLYAYMQTRSKLIEFVLGNLATIIAALRQPDAVPGDLVERLREVVSSAYYTGAEDVHRAWIADLGQLDADFGEAASDYAASVELPDFAAAIQSLTAERDAALALVAELASELESELDAKGIYDTPRKMVRNRQTVVKARALLEGSKP